VTKFGDVGPVGAFPRAVGSTLTSCDVKKLASTRRVHLLLLRYKYLRTAVGADYRFIRDVDPVRNPSLQIVKHEDMRDRVL